MTTSKQFFILFIPAILIVFVAAFIRFTEWSPVYGDEASVDVTDSTNAIVTLYPEDPIVGFQNAPLTIVAFEDFGCAGCRAQMDLLHTIMTTYPKKIKIIWKGLAVTRIPYPSDIAHLYAYCANLQNKFEEFADKAFAINGNFDEVTIRQITTEISMNQNKLDACLNSSAPQIYKDKTEALARSLNIQSVPAMFINNKQIEPPRNVEGWQTLLGL